jgi:hypothetical protein
LKEDVEAHSDIMADRDRAADLRYLRPKSRLFRVGAL